MPNSASSPALAPLTSWLAELGRIRDLDRLVDHLLPKVRHYFGATYSGLLLRSKRHSAARVAAYCHRRVTDGSGPERSVVHVPDEIPDSRWQKLEPLFALSRSAAQRLVMLEGGHVLLAFELRDAWGGLLLGPREDRRGHSIATQELLGFLSLHLSSLVERHLLEDPFEALTGLLRRNAVFEHLHRELDNASLDGDPVTIGIVQLDQLDAVHSELGSRAAERLFNTVCAEMRSALRPTDLIGRYAGHEMLLVLPATSLVEAGALISGLRERIRDLQADVAAGVSRTTTLSIGLLALEYGSPAVSSSRIEDLVGVADFALLRAREQGGDQVQKWSWRQIGRLGL